MVDLYGIPNCDTVKKARKWLDANDIGYTFHDYKKEGADADQLKRWIATFGVDTVVNKRGTTYRRLSDAEKEQAASPDNAASLLVQHPSMIKRPVVEDASTLLIGFKENEWSAALS